MKNLAAVLLIALMAFGVVAGAAAQSSTYPTDTQAPSSSRGPASGTDAASTPSPEVKGQVDVDRKSPQAQPGVSDDGAALPRTVASERTTIFGLSPTAAIIIAAALLVVVILAIVAMTRSNDTYIDVDRRM
jgi:hypothetical protein